MNAQLPLNLRVFRVIALLGIASTVIVASAAAAQKASLQDIAKALRSLPQIVIYQAKEIVTLDSARPTAQAVAVVGDRILAVGSLNELKAAAGKQPYVVETMFADKVIVPGFIAQHDHPMLAALTMTRSLVNSVTIRSRVTARSILPQMRVHSAV